MINLEQAAKNFAPWIELVLYLVIQHCLSNSETNLQAEHLDGNIDFILKAGILDIRNSSIRIGKTLLWEEDKKGTAKHTQHGRRVRHQIHIYKILKFLEGMKKNGIEIIVIRGMDDFINTNDATKIFRLNLAENHDGEMIDELDNLLNHISGFNSKIKKLSIGERGERLFGGGGN